MKKPTKKVVKKSISKSNTIDQIKVIVEKFEDILKRAMEGVSMKFETIESKLKEHSNHFESLDNKMDNIELELSQVKDVVLDIQQEKVSTSDFLTLEKRVTKLEMNNAKPTRK